MEGRALPRADPNSFLSDLYEFCAGSVATCFSRDADKHCVSAGLSCLSALCLLLSTSLLVCQRCRGRREDPGEIITFLYSLVGHLCATVGATLSRQLHIQILMSAVAAAMDAVHFLSWCFPVFLCWNSKAERRLRSMRGRRGQHLLAVCVLMVFGVGSLQCRVLCLPAERPLSGRRLMHITFQDNTEILGYILGLLSFIIACTFRFPVICRAYKGQVLTEAHMFFGLLSSLAGVLYAAAILLYDTQFGFLLKVMPWLLSALCCVTLDLLILALQWFKRRKQQQLTSLFPDTESLLGFLYTENNTAMMTQRKQQLYSSAQRKAKNVQNMTEMGRYMDVTVKPARKIFLKEVMSEEEMEDQLLNRKVRVIRVDGVCSSDTSFDSSLSSELEPLALTATRETSFLCSEKKPSNGGHPLTRNKVGF